MAFKKQQTQFAGGNKGLPLAKLNDPAYHDEVNLALDAMFTQDAKIVYLHRQGWAAKQMCDLVLETRKGTRTPEQHVHTVLKKHGLNGKQA
jgi:hypothetical protein